MKLLSMIDYVYLQSNNDNLLEASETNDMFMTIWNKIFKYAQFLNKPLKLEMFVLCDDDGIPLPYHIGLKSGLKIYDIGSKYIEKAKNKKTLIFKNMGANYDKENDSIRIYNITNDLNKMTSFYINKKTENIFLKDLVNHQNLELTKPLKKLIALP